MISIKFERQKYVFDNKKKFNTDREKIFIRMEPTNVSFHEVDMYR